jgi:hypothetical protein
MNEAHESKRPIVLFPKDKNNDQGKDNPQKRIAILAALAKSLTKQRGRV